MTERNPQDRHFRGRTGQIEIELVGDLNERKTPASSPTAQFRLGDSPATTIDDSAKLGVHPRIVIADHIRPNLSPK